MSNNDVIKIEIDRTLLDQYIANLDSAIAGGGRGGSSVSGGRRIGQPRNPSWKQDQFIQRFVAASNQYYGTHRGVSTPVDFMGFARQPQAAQQQMIKKGIKETILGLNTPTLSREQRIVLNQMGFPTRAFYNFKRFQKGVAAGLLSSPTGILTTAALIIMIHDQIRKLQRNLEQKEREYKNIFLEYKPDMTKREFQTIKDQNQNQWFKMMNYVFRGK